MVEKNKKNDIDISEEKRNRDLLFTRAQEDLNDLEKYIEEFTAFLPLAVCTINPLNVILDVNKAFCNLTGYEEIEAIGKRVEELFRRKKEFKRLSQDELIRKSSGFSQKMTLITAGDQEIPVNMSLSPRWDEDNNFLGYFIAFSDITGFEELRTNLEDKVKERTKDLEEQAKELDNSRTALVNILEDIEEARDDAEEERDKTTAIFENFPEAIFFFDKKDNLDYVNNKIKEFFGLSPKEITGKNIKAFGKEKKLKAFFNALDEDIKEKSKKELTLKEDLALEISIIPIIRAKTKIGTIVTLRDITREKRIDKLKTEFVSIAAHQLRTPLSAIKWTLKMILEGDLGQLSKEQEEFLSKTYISNERMIRLVNDLLDVTRIEEGRFLYNLKKKDIRTLVKKVIASSKERAERKGVELRLKGFNKEVPNILVDVEKISLVFQNLLDNAIHYTGSGGYIEISLKYQKEDNQLLFSFKDTGIGIPKDQHKRVFSKFFRGANAIKTETEGTGLGLFISKNIVDAHGGKIWFESKENQGTTFYFTLPLNPSKTKLASEPSYPLETKKG
jgi:PAS domain S-box-containing protein